MPIESKFSLAPLQQICFLDTALYHNLLNNFREKNTDYQPIKKYPDLALIKCTFLK